MLLQPKPPSTGSKDPEKLKANAWPTMLVFPGPVESFQQIHLLGPSYSYNSKNFNFLAMVHLLTKAYNLDIKSVVP